MSHRNPRHRGIACSGEVDVRLSATSGPTPALVPPGHLPQGRPVGRCRLRSLGGWLIHYRVACCRARVRAAWPRRRLFMRTDRDRGITRVMIRIVRPRDAQGTVLEEGVDRLPHYAHPNGRQSNSCSAEQHLHSTSGNSHKPQRRRSLQEPGAPLEHRSNWRNSSPRYADSPGCTLKGRIGLAAPSHTARERHTSTTNLTTHLRLAHRNLRCSRSRQSATADSRSGVIWITPQQFCRCASVQHRHRHRHRPAESPVDGVSRGCPARRVHQLGRRRVVLSTSHQVAQLVTGPRTARFPAQHGRGPGKHRMVTEGFPHSPAYYG
jgi:hypothetical protein